MAVLEVSGVGGKALILSSIYLLGSVLIGSLGWTWLLHDLVILVIPLLCLPHEVVAKGLVVGDSGSILSLDDLVGVLGGGLICLLLQILEVLLVHPSFNF